MRLVFHLLAILVKVVAPWGGGREGRREGVGGEFWERGGKVDDQNDGLDRGRKVQREGREGGREGLPEDIRI